MNQQPNVLFLFTDQQRADTIYAPGKPRRLVTPALDALAQLGMTDVQTPGAADFTPLTTANQLPLALTEAKHAARVKIDEDGCEAAAYTILSVCETAAMPPEEIVEFKLDEPFVFAITGADGLPLFVGIVNQVS